MKDVDVMFHYERENKWYIATCFTSQEVMFKVIELTEPSLVKNFIHGFLSKDAAYKISHKTVFQYFSPLFKSI